MKCDPKYNAIKRVITNNMVKVIEIDFSYIREYLE